MARRRRRRSPPPPPPRYVWTYECVWVDENTEREWPGGTHRVITESNTNYQQASRLARLAATVDEPPCVERIIAHGDELRLRCRRSMEPFLFVPESPEFSFEEP